MHSVVRSSSQPTGRHPRLVTASFLLWRALRTLARLYRRHPVIADALDGAEVLHGGGRIGGRVRNSERLLTCRGFGRWSGFATAAGQQAEQQEDKG